MSKRTMGLTAMAVGAPGRRPIGGRSGSYSRKPSRTAAMEIRFLGLAARSSFCLIAVGQEEPC